MSINMQAPGTRGRAIGLALSLAAALSGCQSAPTPDQMSRTATETAPADLQLLCASEAARSRGIDSSKVLPTGSRKLDARTYQVDLNAGGSTITCTVDDQGKVGAITAI
ncbi:MAG: hypothetical protein M9955_14030 [Rhizobiaceae bacterium]|nr:hypothetical protein [Rhizobiaceae bacterium]